MMNADRQTTRLRRGGKRKQEEIRLLFQQLNYCLELGGRGSGGAEAGGGRGSGGVEAGSLMGTAAPH